MRWEMWGKWLELMGAFWYNLGTSEVSQSEKSIVDAFWIEKHDL